LSQTAADIVESIKYFEKAIELDKDYGRAYAMLAKAYFMGPRQGRKEWGEKTGLLESPEC